MNDATKSQDVNQADIELLQLVIDYGIERYQTGVDDASSDPLRNRDALSHELEAANRFDRIKAILVAHQAGALRGEPEAAGHGSVEGDVRALRQMVADCDAYLKEGETPAQRIERERRDTEAVLNLLIREKQRTEAMREVMLRMMAGIDHLAEIARQWEPDYSSGADRRGWVLAKDARDDAARLIPETHQAASGCSHTARPDDPITKFGIKPHSTLAQLKDDEDLRLYVQAHIEEARSAEQGATPPAPAALKCGHHKSLMLLSAETGQPLYCELCDAISGRRDAELMEAELRAKLAALAASPQPAVPEGWKLVPIDPTNEMLAPLTVAFGCGHAEAWLVLSEAIAAAPAAEGGAL